MASISSVVITGRRMKSSVMFIALARPHKPLVK
jgi:hypothetical protein